MRTGTIAALVLVAGLVPARAADVGPPRAVQPAIVEQPAAVAPVEAYPSCRRVWRCHGDACGWEPCQPICPDGYSCYSLYGGYSPYGGGPYWGAYTDAGWGGR